MPNRFQSKQYEAIYPFIAERDGEYCLVCFGETGQRRGPGQVKLEIDHADNDKHNWAPENLHLLCKTHNIKLRSLKLKLKLSLLAAYSAENESVRVRKNEFTAESKRRGLYLSGSPEMQVNSRALAKWREYMHGMIDANGSISKEDAINGGAIAAEDVDVQTTTRYYKKDTSIRGRFKEIRIGGEIRIVYRDSRIELKSRTNGRHNGQGKGEIADTVPMVKTELSGGKRGD